MSTTILTDDRNNNELDSIGAQLAILRQQKGYTVEYIASKLNLRAKIIELIEADDYHELNGAVFVMGYLRSYSRLLDVSPDPFLAAFNKQYHFEKKPERALWQSKRESHRAEFFIKLITILFAIGVIVAVGLWWQKNREVQSSDTAKEESLSDLSLNLNSNEIRLTDLSKMKSILATTPEMTPLEKEGG
jgi:cytoskeletal protein RodZ